MLVNLAVSCEVAPIASSSVVNAPLSDSCLGPVPIATPRGSVGLFLASKEWKPSGEEALRGQSLLVPKSVARARGLWAAKAAFCSYKAKQI